MFFSLINQTPPLTASFIPPPLEHRCHRSILIDPMSDFEDSESDRTLCEADVFWSGRIREREIEKPKAGMLRGSDGI